MHNSLYVEIDEYKLDKRKFNRGDKIEGVYVSSMVERTQ